MENILERVEAYRQKVYKLIDKAGGPDKSYDGAIDVSFPSRNGDEYSITLHCYVLGPSRHYHYYGKSLQECLKKAEQDLWLWDRFNHTT